MTTISSTTGTYFDRYGHLRMSRDADGVLLVEMHTNGGPIHFDATDHMQFVDAVYEIGRDRENKVVILTGVSDWMAEIDFASFGNVGDANRWSKVHDEGTQILENLANIRGPVIAAVEGRAHVHTEYALMANVVVASRGATFTDLPHFAGGIVPGDGILRLGHIAQAPAVPKPSSSIRHQSRRRPPRAGASSHISPIMGKQSPSRAISRRCTSSSRKSRAATPVSTSSSLSRSGLFARSVTASRSKGQARMLSSTRSPNLLEPQQIRKMRNDQCRSRPNSTPSRRLGATASVPILPRLLITT